MNELAPNWGIDDERIKADKAKVRLQQIQRYEGLWNVVANRIQQADDDERPLDPRFLEIGIRVLKEEATLYQLNKVNQVEEDDDDPNAGVDRAQLVLEQLSELEARARSADVIKDPHREPGPTTAAGTNPGT